MNTRIPVTLTPDLVLRLGAKATRLTPATGFDLAQKLIRHSSRQMVKQEVTRAQARVSSVTTRKPVTR